MAPTKKKRRRKHRGTQGGRVDTRPKGRPRNRAEARQRAQSKGSKKTKGSGNRAAVGARTVGPPTWGGAIKKGAVAALVFFALIAVVFGRGPGPAAGLAGFMLVFYVPMAYYTDRFFYNRQLRKAQQERTKAKQGG
ncbi:hypothetical protein BH20ACT15_BH20ACT15_15120 [soil metagenome]